MMKFKSVFSSVLAVALVAVCAVACSFNGSRQVTILHTNDTHSQIEPIESGKRNGNMAGYARRMGLIAQERTQDPELLLLDAGDFSQGTPYYNIYRGRVEVDALNRMGYDAVTLGNHEFDYGVDTLAAVLQDARFAVVCANYDVAGSALEGIVKPYVVLRKNGVRVGVFGLGINPENLISAKNFAPLRYIDPVVAAQQTVSELREQHQCDLVVCLSHLGTDIKTLQQTTCDTIWAKSVDGI